MECSQLIGFVDTRGRVNRQLVKLAQNVRDFVASLKKITNTEAVNVVREEGAHASMESV